jgi:hypothetical protein
MESSSARVSLAVSVLTAALAGCGGGSSGSHPGSQTSTGGSATGGSGASISSTGGTGGTPEQGGGLRPTIVGPAADLARAVTTAASLDDAVTATQQVLAKVGVSVMDPTTGEVISDGGGMVAIWPSHVLNLAEQARNEATSSTIALDDLSDLFSDMDAIASTPFTPATSSDEVDGSLAPMPYVLDTGTAPGDELVLLLSSWVRAALAAPNDPDAFPPLFLAAMAQAQNPPVDLTDPNLAPEDVHLTLLDLEVMLSGLAANGADSAATGTAHAGRLARAANLEAIASDTGPTISTPAFMPVTCDFFPDPVTGFPIPLIPTPPGETNSTPTVSKYVKMALDTVKAAQDGAKNGLVDSVPDPTARAKLLVSLALKIFRVIEFYQYAQISLAVDNPMVHLPLVTETPYPTRTFTATAGIPDADYQRFKDTYSKVAAWLKDCASKWGIPSLPDLGDLLKEIPSWRVNWIVHGNLADISPASRASRLPRAGGFETALMVTAPENKGQSSLQFTMHAEQPQLKQHTGPKETRPFKVEADLDASQPTSVDTLLSGVSGFYGAIGGAADIAVDWFRSLNQPKSFATLAVEYHYVQGWHGTIKMRQSIGTWRQMKWFEIGGACAESYHFVDRVKLRLTRDYTILGSSGDPTKAAYGGPMLGYSEQECFASHQVDTNDTGTASCGEFGSSDASKMQTSESYDQITEVNADGSGSGSTTTNPDWNVNLLVTPPVPAGVSVPASVASMFNTYSLFAGGGSCDAISGVSYDFTAQDGPEITSLDPTSLPLKLNGLSVQNEPVPDDMHLTGTRTSTTTVDYGGFESVPLITTYRWDLTQ